MHAEYLPVSRPLDFRLVIQVLYVCAWSQSEAHAEKNVQSSLLDLFSAEIHDSEGNSPACIHYGTVVSQLNDTLKYQDN